MSARLPSFHLRTECGVLVAVWHDDDGVKPFGDSGLYEVRYRKQV
jgi:hypothetical protein